ncbi:unnamed protein product [Peronospora belbahrii]|uniref:Glucose-6-phosphate 1-epimerase n=1 Tax=Peronospora belbahrii TaxID=622444 RepID=A0AAU9L7N9_9STRA|nr:unnamed protein product [Peronospora belbahrii]CAH0513909.1 unnamed protein product [Peronospora belbahrii]
MDHTVTIKKAGFISCKSCRTNVTTKTDVVVWNPWAERAKVMQDFGDMEYKNMVAIEPGRVNVKQPLSAGKTYTLKQTISVTSL